MRPIHRISGLSPVERMVIDTLRRAAAGPVEPESACFALLASAARVHGAIILRSTAPLLGADEAMVVGWLARYQRRWDQHVGALSPDLDAALVACADILATRCWRLPYIAIRRFGGIDGMAVPQPAKAPLLPKKNIDVRGVREAALDLIALRRVVPLRELKEIGISQQHLTSLCRAGILEPAGSGLYRLGSAVDG